MNSDSIGQVGLLKPIRLSIRRLLGPGGAGDRVVFGYMFRVIYSVAAVITASTAAMTWVLATGRNFSGAPFWFFCFGALFIMTIGEALRRKVYETYSNRRENILTAQDSAASAMPIAELEKHLQNFSKVRLSQLARVKKRALDLTIALFALACLAPLFLVVALLVKFDSSGPILVRQASIGSDGQPFYLFKFRTMKILNEGRSNDIFLQQEVADTYVTRVGRFLRRTSIDEIPQILNVISGKMSIVGPRPIYLDSKQEYYRGNKVLRIFFEGYFDVKPGLTGLALYSGNDHNFYSDTHLLYHQSFDNLIELRISYIKDWSIWRDLDIIFRTAFALFRQRD